jgi:hypothetical protein
VAQFGSASALGAGGRRFKSYHSDLLNTQKMQIYTVEEVQEHWDEMIARVEGGEHIGITNKNNTCVMIPADEELIRIYTEHNEAS